MINLWANLITSTEKPFLPKGLALGSQPTYKTKPFTSFTLDSKKNNVAVLDYGHEVGGQPFFDVQSLSGPAQIEVKYTEAYHGLEEPFSDGPLLYGNQLANNFRIETLNITKTGRYDVFLIQGGQRWESLRLLTEGSIKFSNVGFHASFANVDPDKEPGFFECSDKRLNEIWKAGVRGAQSSCLEQGSQPSTWRVDPKNGVLVQSLRPIQSEKSPVVGNHTVEFEAKIVRGGFWYGVVSHHIEHDFKYLLTMKRPGRLVKVVESAFKSRETCQRRRRSRTTTTRSPLETLFKLLQAGAKSTRLPCLLIF